MQQDARERLDLYPRAIARVVADVRRTLGETAQDRTLWMRIKAAYAHSIVCRPDFELAETFFNSVTSRILDTVGVDPKIHYLDSDSDAPPSPPDEPVYRKYVARGALRLLVREDRKSTRLNSSHIQKSRMPSSA